MFLMMMMDIKATSDFSSYFLFEATGDSEALSDPIMDDVAFSDDDDDAQSCSYDASETHNVSKVINGYVSHHELDDDEKKEDEEVCFYGRSYYEDDDDDEIQQPHKSSESVDSSSESLVDEIEKNRRFWEACLRS
ncbi:phosphopantothenoylcysteine decarboxylase subunit VHS3 [Senna tora]|uniref:Phosphopantothenoylcysteine decarboxylase subunit VHS3 n=1 Tax=Senna tora TaxID=362788 RepID=A0A834WER4_9FABA|nr:phosphopantothenoylcysteine decarboxylase subunit VHS3 [Senna tora]